ncbi:hypothetical protein Raf01_77840 [Rugosimonospora africana]|uniref:Carrier domain-containing protein n=2 Tax=Rugosimonospora africana TaxID=556532 RepID=A0A8J3R0L8_9ACTN|nr:hypothetical protein Raf01_77840 [Rugosimonospora africana]
MVAAQAARRPHHTAVEWDTGRLTYAELVAAAAPLAHLLGRAGAGPEVPVAILVPRGPGMVVALLAILQAGAAYVPLDANDALPRQRAILADSGAGILVTGPGSVVSPGDVPDVSVLDLGELSDRLAELPSIPPDVPVRADNLVYIMYTSGSTGRPKGVQVEHRNVANLVRGDYVDFDADLTFCGIAPLAFDQSTFEIWGALANGNRLVLAPPGVLGPEQIGDLVQRHAITLLCLTKGLFNVVIEARAPGLGGVRRLLTGGDRLSPVHVRQAIELLPTTVLSNCYGPTEATTFTTVYRDVPLADIADSVPIGVPIPGCRVYVLDEAHRPVPVGDEGELYIGGAGVARGYTDPELTRRWFVADPFADDPEARMYRTGDRARRRPDGSLLFVGRTDSQVKVRGHRVEPGEVEHVLATLPGVRDVCCVARQNTVGERHLVAYVVGSGVDAEQVRAHAEAHLPPYLRPSFVEVLAELPLNRNGKVDRAALPPPTVPAPRPDPERPARTDAEAYLAHVWRHLLGHEPGADDDFFAVGGDSLIAMRLVSRLRQDTGKAVTLAEFFDAPTPRGLAALLAKAPAAPGAGTGPGGGELQGMPLSPFQHGMWVAAQLHPRAAAYHVPMAFEIHGSVDADALERAVAVVVARHEALRTTIDVVDGVPVQRVAERVDARLTRASLTWRAGGDETLRQYLARGLARPMDLREGPLWRAEFYTDGADRHALLFVVHHLVSDGWSMELIKRDLSLAYRAACEGGEPDWPTPAVRFAALTALEFGEPARARVEQETGYWLRQLADPWPRLDLPTRPDRPPVPRGEAAEVSRVLSPPTAAALRSLARRHGVSLFSVLLSGFAVMLSRCGGRERFCLGTPLAVRDQPGAEEAVGFLTNTVVLPCTVEDEESFLDLVAATHRGTRAALGHPHVPFEALVARLAPDRQPGRNPLFDVWFNMLSYQNHPLVLGQATVRSLPPPPAGAQFDLTAYLDDHDGEIDMRFVYDPDVFAADRVTAMVEQTGTILEAALRDPGQPVGGLLGADPARHAPAPALVPAVGLLDRVSRHPGDRPALEHGEAVLTYTEVLAAARRTADRLAADGVGAGNLVALASGRTPELVTGMLGAWLVGAAFTTLDPAYPRRRLAEALESLRPAAVHGGAHTAELASWLASRLRVPVTGPVGEPVPAGPSAQPRRLDPRVAYVLPTSGTTGHPLYVTGAEAPLSVFFTWYADAFGLGPADRFAVLAGLSHDPLLRETLLPVWLGATACLPTDGTAEPDALLDWIVARGITVVHATPAMLRLLAAGAGGRRQAPAVRLVALGGAVIGPAEYRAALALFPQARRIGLYGATETPQGISTVDLDREFASGTPGAAPLGAGSPSAEVGVLRVGTVTRAVVNEAGEVYVRSPHLALGYLDQPELTADRFVPDAWQPGSGSRVFRTGDRGRLRPDGTVEFLGRLDDQLSLDGHRADPAEIERVLAEHPDVVDCGVAMVRDRLVAAVRWRDPSAPPTDLPRHLADRLPPAMLPTATVVVERVPLTPRGKLDRRAVAALLAEVGTGEPAAIAVEELVGTLQRLWRDVLGVDAIDVDRTFFELGGTSLTLLRMYRMLPQHPVRTLSLVDLFRYPTVRQLAAALAGSPPGGAPAAAAVALRQARAAQADRAREARRRARATTGPADRQG